MSALLVIDMQNDFITGSLAVKESEKLIPYINSMIQKFSNVLYTQDNHPDEHISFNTSSIIIEKEFFLQLDETTRKYLKAFNPHCIQKTFGQELHKDLLIKDNSAVFLKGENQFKEEFSAFANKLVDEYLQKKSIKKVFIVGLAYDFCVAETAFDAKKLGYDVYVVKDLSKPIFENQVKELDFKFKSVGINVVSTEEVFQML